MARKLRHMLNPCDVDRFEPLSAVGDALALVWDALTHGTECACCLGARLLAVTAAAFGLGYLLG